MSLPPVDAVTGLLPAGRHPATWHEVYDVFVLDAPASPFRQRTFEAASVWLLRAAELLGPGLAWVDGGFTTWKQDVPHDVDIVYLPSDAPRANRALADSDVYGLLTLQDAVYAAPHPGGHLQRLQPMGGLVDAFIADGRSAADRATWDNIWNKVKGRDGKIVPGAIKGYMEVANP